MRAGVDECRLQITPTNPIGNNEIVCNGLRPGEKLYEELLIDADFPAHCPSVDQLRPRGGHAPPAELWPQTIFLEAAIARQDVEAALGRALGGRVAAEW